MKELADLLKLLAAFAVIFIVIPLGIMIFDTRQVTKFCGEMTTGLDVNQIHILAEKYDVGFSNVRDPDSVKNKKLGLKISDNDNVWRFFVGVPATMGESGCAVYHDYKTIISAKLGVGMLI